MEEQMYMPGYVLRRMRRVQRQLAQLQAASVPQALLVSGSTPPERSIIVFPGSFNPPTQAHLALLKQAWRYAREHGVMSVYAALSTHIVDKETVERPLLVDRVMLLNTLLKRRLTHSGVLLCNRGLYVEQAQAIRASFRHVKRIFFLLGFDKIVQILDPRYYEDRDSSLEALFALAQLLVAPRGNDGEAELHALIHQPQNERFARFIQALPLDRQYRTMSSTHIRQGVQGSEHDVPQEVRAFMRRTRAYAPPLRHVDGSEVDYYGERINLLRRLL